ncbi:hypothetical protein [Plantactinospora sonchi]|uniref:Uncharacterized protein n=1 Tax=Plantactinospora sonchi TaxID=1544735 RepID=A0ABU7S1N3_9ACTN
MLTPAAYRRWRDRPGHRPTGSDGSERAVARGVDVVTSAGIRSNSVRVAARIVGMAMVTVIEAEAGTWYGPDAAVGW